MPNEPGGEPNNAAAEVMREIAGLRGVNTTLRAATPLQNDAPPLNDEEVIEDFRRTTGLIIDANGNVIGKDPTWTGGAPAPLIEVKDAANNVQLSVSTPTNTPEVNEPPALMNGIDIDQQVVVVDGEYYDMSEAETKAVMVFTSQVMIESVQRRAKERLDAAGIKYTENVRGADGNVQEVPQGKAPGSVPKGQKPPKR